MKSLNLFNSKKVLLILLVFSFMGLVNAQKKSSISSDTKDGLRTTTFKTKKGDIKVYLPSNVHAGDVISGTVVAEPKGKNKKQVNKNRNILNGYVVELEGRDLAIKQGKEKWKLPDISNGISRLLLKDIKGNILEDFEIPINPESRISILADIDKSDFKIPNYIIAGEPTIIQGIFDGDFSTSDLKINGLETNILAESPEGLFFEAPIDISGPAFIELTEDENLVESQTNMIDLNLSADKLNLIKGETTRIHIEVSGLQGIGSVSVPIEIRNLTPASINMEGGNNQRIEIQAEEINEDGTFTKQLDVRAIRAGGFSVMVNIEAPEPGFIKLISPIGKIYDSPASQPISFKWESYEIPDNYTLKIWSLAEDMTNEIDLSTEEPTFIEEGIEGTSFVYPHDFNLMIGGKIHTNGGTFNSWKVEAMQGGKIIATSLCRTFNFLPDSMLLASIKGPTYGVPGVNRNHHDELDFKDEKAVRKWVNIRGAKKKLKKLEDNIKDQEDYHERIKDDPSYGEIAKGVLEKIKKMKSTTKKVKKHIKKAEASAKACNLEDTRKHSQHAKETAETGVDTGGSNLGFPKPKAGETGVTVPGHRGDATIPPKYKEKFEAVSKAIKKIEEMEKKLEDLETESIFGEEKIKEYEERLKKLKGTLAEAEKNLAEMNKHKAYSKESEIMQEVAKEMVDELKEKVKEFEEGLEEAKENNKDKEGQKEAIKKLNKDLRDAYKQLKIMYSYAKKCNTKKVQEKGKKIQEIADNSVANEENEEASISELEGVAQEAEKAGETAKKATSSKTNEMKEADKKYFDGLYSSLLANYLKMKGNAPHSVDDFLGYQGSTSKEVTSFDCQVGDKTYTVNVNLNWTFGASPQPDNKKPAGNGPDGKYEYTYDGFQCVSPININITASIILYWVGPYSEMASNKALLYHEFLHGQLMIEWLKKPVNQAEICDAIKRICGDKEAGVKVPLAGSVDDEHKDINKWQKKFQDDIEKAEEKKAKKEKEKAKKKYKASLKK